MVRQMHILLIHNPKSGGGDLPGSEMVDRLRLLDGDAICVSVEDDYAAALEKAGAGTVVVTAGGDGTVHKVARALAWRGASIAVLPMGTANNIADTLGKRWDLESLVRLLPHAVHVPFDLGKVTHGGRPKVFMESVGVGVVAAMIRTVDCQKDAGVLDKRDEMTHALEVMHEIVRNGDPIALRLGLDGGEMIEASCLALEIMNVASIGPRLRLVADRDPRPGHFSVVLVREEARGALLQHIESRMAGEVARPSFETLRATSVILEWDDADVHIDDELLDVEDSPPHSLNVELLPEATSFVVPPG